MTLFKQKPGADRRSSLTEATGSLDMDTVFAGTWGLAPAGFASCQDWVAPVCQRRRARCAMGSCAAATARRSKSSGCGSRAWRRWEGPRRHVFLESVAPGHCSTALRKNVSAEVAGYCWAMSEENVELVRSVYRQGDPSRFFDLLDEEIEVDASAVGGSPTTSLRDWSAARMPWSTTFATTGEPGTLRPGANRDHRCWVMTELSSSTNERGRGRGEAGLRSSAWATLYPFVTEEAGQGKGLATPADALEVAGLSE